MKRKPLVIILDILLVLAVIANFVLATDFTSGTSMDPTLKDGQPLWVMRPTAMRLLHVNYNRGDIVIAKNDVDLNNLTKGELIVKRVIGTPKETVSVGRKTVYINDKALKEPYVVHKMDNLYYSYGGVANGGQVFNDANYKATTKLGSNQYFLMGDNRPASADSRWIGAVKQSQLQGKVIVKLPFNAHNLSGRLFGQILVYTPLILLLLSFLASYLYDLRAKSAKQA
ncbi:signal peptidase I [Lacticaseibacillus brantae]|uniref:Signal peptidase I n=1 Tax=Lacticaseibacillus brantae DSM 23927 TaxID=1423727 RepID=A0A0R2B1D4_9LACO|nr:signal peptidase I [Lacticaseibacillus brantae]KRM73104.1 hypothetical protein FC34_GL000828 [Lacticaseibacillus brantae DSM 23927]